MRSLLFLLVGLTLYADPLFVATVSGTTSAGSSSLSWIGSDDQIDIHFAGELSGLGGTSSYLLTVILKGHQTFPVLAGYDVHHREELFGSVNSAIFDTSAGGITEFVPRVGGGSRVDNVHFGVLYPRFPYQVAKQEVVTVLIGASSQSAMAFDVQVSIVAVPNPIPEPASGCIAVLVCGGLGLVPWQSKLRKRRAASRQPER